jgi:hypothetical protein
MVGPGGGGGGIFRGRREVEESLASRASRVQVRWCRRGGAERPPCPIAALPPKKTVYGFGNWAAVSEHVGTKSKDACRDHYFATYIDVPTFPLPSPSPEMAGVRSGVV